MARYTLAAVVGCLYVAVAAWIVHSEGVAYREALRLARVAATPAEQVPGPGRLAAKEPETSAGLAPVPSPPPPPETPVVASPPDHDGPAAKVPAEPSTPDPPPDRVDLAAKVAEPAQPSLTPAPRPERPVSDPTPGPDTAWADALDLAHLAPEDEGRLGVELQRLILAQAQSLTTDKDHLIERSRKAARRVSGDPYQVTVLESNAVNAFSHPGGCIYVCRGVFDLIGSDEDYALEFVIGHEIAHLELKHALKCVAPGNAAAKQRGIDTLHQFFVPIILGYPDAQEFEADAWIYTRMMSKLDHTRRESLAFLRKLQGYAEIHEFTGKDGPPRERLPGLDPALFENHFRHPPAWDRLDRLKALLIRPAPALAPVPAPTR